MKKTFLRKKLISAGVVAATIGALVPLGVSAKGKIETLNYNQKADEEIVAYEKSTDNKIFEELSTEENTGVEENSNNSQKSVSYSNRCGKQGTILLKINDELYCFDRSGNVKTGWIKKSGKWYYADNDGKIQTGVIKINEKIYYFNKYGVMQTGRVRIENKIYRFAKNGELIGNDVPDIKKEFDSNNNLIIKDNESVDDKENTGNNESTGDEGNEIEKPEEGTEIENPDNNESGNNGSDSSDIIMPDEKPDSKPEDSETSGDVTENENKPGNSNGQLEDNNISNENGSGSIGSISVEGLPAVKEKYSVKIENSAENKILELMNQKRKEAGLNPLTMDNTLLSVARYKSNHMIQNDYFSHTNPDGTQWTNWLKTIGYKYNATAENIAYNSYDPVELFNQWWNSSGHRQNMMNPSYTKVGIGVVYGNGKYMGTQTFSN
ncbi:CAP domain-containing protein [uncultured Clostridium sp.]|uniref:CAP domain-containing protein n=1 Tax=uncultured Clostridium sp. TaxID=59620 RepID=UPI0025DF90AA|nr:CAP domain-containing protein [uncultured Clostridium sp.]